MGFTDEIEELILNGDYEEARDEILKESNASSVDHDGMNLMTRVFDVGLRTACTQEQFLASTQILCHITRTMSPKEALITLLEQIEMVGLDHKLYCVLQPLQIALDRLPNKWETNLKWALEILDKRVRLGEKPAGLELSQGENRFRAEELRAAESTEGCLRLEVYNPILGFANFYEYCFNHILTHPKDLEGPDAVVTWKMTLRNRILSLLSSLKLWPFTYPNDDSGDGFSRLNAKNNFEPEETGAFQVAAHIVNLLEKLGTTTRFYHEYLERQIDDWRQNNSKNNNKVIQNPRLPGDIDELDEEIDPVALASYLYVVHGKNLDGSHRHGPSSPVSQVYTGLFLVSRLCSQGQDVEVQVKALGLAHFLLDQLCPVSPFHRLLPGLLDTKVHEEFQAQLAYAFTYSDCREVRRLGALVFKSYLWAFNAAGRSKFVNSILNSTTYSDSLYGFVVTQLREFSRHALEKLEGKSKLKVMGVDEPLLPEMEVYFIGKNLQVLLRPVIQLRNGPNTDLLSCENQVMAALNLIRFLLLRDGKRNLAGIRDYLVEEVQQDFLANVHKAVDRSILQAKGRLKELEDPDTPRRELREALRNKWDGVVMTDAEGNALPEPENFSLEDQVESCKNVLSKMDLLQCLLAHTNECYESLVRSA